jgi:hypothetical protein
MRAVQHVAQQSILSCAEDSTGTDDWVAVPRLCTLTKLNPGFLGTSSDFACTTQAFNPHRHLTPRFRVVITCANPTPTVPSCGSESGHDPVRLPGIRRVTGPVPAAVISELAGTDFSLILRSCLGRTRPTSAAQINTAVDYDRLYQEYGTTAFRLVAGGPVVSMEKLLREATLAGRGCQPELTAILAAALPGRRSPTA